MSGKDEKKEAKLFEVSMLKHDMMDKHIVCR